MLCRNYIASERDLTCAPQKVDPALIARFRPAMFGCFVPPASPVGANAPFGNQDSRPRPVLPPSSVGEMTLRLHDRRVPVRQCPPILPGATLPVLRWRVTPPGTHEIPRPIPVREGVVSKNTNELKTCISQSVSYRRVYACFAKGSCNAWS